MKVNMRGGGTLDRVVVNEPRTVYVRMYMNGGYVRAFAIMKANDVL